MSDPGVDEVTHRGVRWQRAPNGALRWHDDDAGGWVRYRRGSDAPPRPPGWESRRGLLPAGVTMDRPSWRTPYRIVPVVLIVVVLVIGVSQALGGSGGQTAHETTAAEALVGKCLVATTGAGVSEAYSSKGVPCTSPGVTVKVTRVLPGRPGSPACPGGTSTVVLAYPGVRYPHQLCTVPAG